jgi:hypothetical protein
MESLNAYKQAMALILVGSKFQRHQEQAVKCLRFQQMAQN